MNNGPEMIAIEKISPHPDNPRIGKVNEASVRLLMGLIGSKFDPAHAPKVRPFKDGYQMVSGHNRLEASKRNGITHIPCWVRDMSDEEANDHLDLDNTQSELSALERGMHAKNTIKKFGVGAGAGNKGGVRDYARKRGVSEQALRRGISAAVVAEEVEKCDVDVAFLKDKVNHLYEVSRLKKDDWGRTVKAVLQSDLSSKETRRLVNKMLGKDKEEKLKNKTIRESEYEKFTLDGWATSINTALYVMSFKPSFRRASAEDLAQHLLNDICETTSESDGPASSFRDHVLRLKEGASRVVEALDLIEERPQMEVI